MSNVIDLDVSLKHKMARLTNTSNHSQEVADLAQRWLNLRRKAISINEQMITAEAILYHLLLNESEKK